jgi:hypothetical protein
MSSQIVTLTMAQGTAVCSAYGTTFDVESACIISFIEEDGELKVLRAKEFSNPQPHSSFRNAKAAAEGAPAS